jgi:hypothetical protein
MEYVSTQATLYDLNEPNAITNLLLGTLAEGMRSDDFMSWFSDIPAGEVQYGKRTEYCDYITSSTGGMEYLFNLLATISIADGDEPIRADTNAGAKITLDTIDFTYSSRQWGYQWCTEFGWF